MKLTNNSGLPQAVFEALARKEYSRGDADISVTELIDSPRIRQLKIKHDSEIELEAESLLASFLGMAFHKAVEVGTVTGVSERRLDVTVFGWKLSGGMDHYDPETGTLTDYKTATVWKTQFSDGGVIPEFEKQLNVYAHILRTNGHVVNKLKIFMLFKDWNARSFSSANKSAKVWQPWQRSGYPEKTWAYFEVPLWTGDMARQYVKARVQAHQIAETDLPLCTAEEVWRGQRCLKYCSAAKFCDQFKKQSATGLMED